LEALETLPLKRREFITLLGRGGVAARGARAAADAGLTNLAKAPDPLNLAGLQNRKHLVPARLNDGFGWRGHSFFI
ncbi:MAG TPA: hypothetical protein VFR54_10110, partial [Xanthobacteraceae bacterium]|nr:hypothetical protein [Xanthobacteraceae bacterium]